jgi:ribose transport system substrate-binding protein
MSEFLRSKRLFVAAVGLMALVAVCVAGCGGGGNSSTTASSEEESSSGGASSESTEGGGVGLKPRTVGMVDIIRQSPIENQMDEMVEEATSEMGWNLEFIDAEGEVSKMQAGVQTLINKGVEGIILGSIDPTVIPKQIANAKAKNIPVIAVGGGVPEDHGKEIGAVYTLDDHAMGKDLAEYIFETTPEAKVVALASALNESGEIRGEEIDSAAEKANAELWTYEVDLSDPVVNSANVVKGALTAHPDANVVYAIFDNMFEGAVTGVEQARSEAKVYSYFTAKPQVEALRSGGPLQAVLDVNLAKTPVLALDQFVGYFEKGTPINRNALKESPLSYEIVSQENIEEKLKGRDQLFPNEEVLAPFLEKWEKE